MRVQGADEVQGPWNGEPIDVPRDWVICLYTRARSSAEGAWLIESVGDVEVWTLSLPRALLNSRPEDVLDTLWRISQMSLPCIGGEEYSMAAVRRSGRDVLVEAASARSLATHAVVHTSGALRNWSALRGEGDRVLLARKAGTDEH